MKIFIAFGFNERDRWVKNMVFPIIEAFGDQVITGDEMYGEEIPDEVHRKIVKSDALIGFLTRRLDEPKGTHHWVLQELSLAKMLRLRFVEVRETGVSDQPGFTGMHQRITYDEARRDECLLALVTTLGRWHNEP